MKVLVLLVALMSLFSCVSGESHDLAKSMGEVRWGENPNPNPNPINPIRKSRVRRGNNDKSDSILMHAIWTIFCTQYNLSRVGSRFVTSTVNT